MVAVAVGFHLVCTCVAPAQENPFAQAAKTAPVPAATDPAKDNPFAQSAPQDFAGRFSADGIYLHLKKVGERLEGSLATPEKTYKVQAAVKNGRLEGQFADEGGAWDFSAAGEGTGLNFKASSFDAKLRRIPFPARPGIYGSSRVWLKLEKHGDAFSGAIKFNGKEFDFTASVLADDLEGLFNDGKKAFPFLIANEPAGLLFQSGPFSEVIKVQSVPGELRVEVIPPMEFTLKADGKVMAGTNGLFAVPAGESVTFALETKDYPNIVTNLTVPAFGTQTWSVVLATQTPQAGQPWNNSLGMRFLPVPKTKTLLCIWETRVRDFEAFVGATRYGAGVGITMVKAEGTKLRYWREGNQTWRKPGFAQTDLHPVVMVSWKDAMAFCGWLTTKERAEGRLSSGQAYRLPTDLEWSAAAGVDDSGVAAQPPAERGLKAPKGRYFWGTQWPPPTNAGNFGGARQRREYDEAMAKMAAEHPEYGKSFVKSIQEQRARQYLSPDSYEDTAPVGSFAANSLGFYDLGGNVMEWCQDKYWETQDLFRDQRTLRDHGYSTLLEPRSLYGPDFRMGQPEEYVVYHLGFRVALAQAEPVSN